MKPMSILVATFLLIAFILTSVGALQDPSDSSKLFDGRNASYVIGGQEVSLVDGEAREQLTPDSASMLVTRYFGNEAMGDVNGDCRDDLVFLLTQDAGGSGTFFYVVAVLDTPNGFQTTNSFFIGDRIAPQSTEIVDETGEIRVNFAERRPGEPMIAQPSVGRTVFLEATPEGVLRIME